MSIWDDVFGLMKKVTGNVDYTKDGSLQEQINKKLPIDGDSADNTVSYTSGDAETPKEWSEVALLEDKETHKSILNKVSTMFANLRYLYNNVGKIKGIIETLDGCTSNTEEGYVASALALSELNSKFTSTHFDISGYLNTELITGITTAWIDKSGNVCSIYLELNFNNLPSGISIINKTSLPDDLKPFSDYQDLSIIKNNNAELKNATLRCWISARGELNVYTPSKYSYDGNNYITGAYICK
jgi:hypothetical protein